MAAPAPPPAPVQRRTQKQTFYDYQQQIRNGVAAAQFVVEWGLKSPAQRRQWFHAAVAVADHIENMQEHEHDRAQTQQQMHDIPNHGNPNLDDYFEACDIAARVVSELQPMYLELGQRWSDLALLEAAQPGLNPASLANAQNQAQAARNQANSTPQVLEAIRQVRTLKDKRVTQATWSLKMAE
jgi:hypothetical protein